MNINYKKNENMQGHFGLKDNTLKFSDRVRLGGDMKVFKKGRNFVKSMRGNEILKGRVYISHGLVDQAQACILHPKRNEKPLISVSQGVKQSELSLKEIYTTYNVLANSGGTRMHTERPVETSSIV